MHTLNQAPTATQPSDSPLTALLYQAKAEPTWGDSALGHLRGQIRDHHALLQITGVLLLLGGQIVHYMEGPQRLLDEALDGMRQSPWQLELHPLYRGAIAQRRYSDWSMAFVPNPWPSEATGVALLGGANAGADAGANAAAFALPAVLPLASAEAAQTTTVPQFGREKKHLSSL